MNNKTIRKENHHDMKNNKKQIVILLTCVTIFLITAIITITLCSINNCATNDIVSADDINVSLEEPDRYEPTSPVEPNQELPKNPQIKNNDTKDAIVFMTVEVPVANITVIADDGTKSAKENSEIIWFKDDTDSASTHANHFDENWIHLSTKDTLSKKSHKYVFAYNTPVAPGARTSALFDKIQIKNFIENEIAGNTAENIVINSYAIQASNVLENNTNLTATLNETTLGKIYDVYVNQNTTATESESSVE